jgi:DNA-binding transcriptional LysR family regulator
MSPHFSILLNKRKKFPGINFKITICDSAQVVELLLSGEIDFGFITTELPHKEIVHKEFVKEEYVLAGPSADSVEITNLKDLKIKNFVKYPGMDVLFENWITTYFQKSHGLQLNDFNICGEMNSLRGAITMVTGGLGLGVFPKHCIEPQLQKKELFLYEGHQRNIAEQPIYIIEPSGKYPTARVKKVLETFWAMKQR